MPTPKSSKFTATYLNDVYAINAVEDPLSFVTGHINHMAPEMPVPVLRRLARLVMGDHKIKTDPSLPLEFLDRYKPFLAGFSEILGKRQDEEITDGMRQRNYNTITDHGQPLWRMEGGDATILGVRSELEKINLPSEILETCHQYGGGIAAGYVPEKDMDAYALHLPLPLPSRMECFNAHIRAIRESIARRAREKARRVIVMADFNQTPEQLSTNYSTMFANGKPPHNGQLSLLSPNQQTCNMMPLVSFFFRECYDHIWGKGLTAKKGKVVRTHSDHAGIVVELEPTDIAAA